MAEVDVYRRYVENPEDWAFLRPLVAHAPSNVLPALFCAYLSTWRAAAMKEALPHRKDNAGRRAANSRLRVDSHLMMAGDTKTRQRYARLVSQGPRQSCATCQHCTLLGECSKGLPMDGALCEKWKADFT